MRKDLTSPWSNDSQSNFIFSSVSSRKPFTAGTAISIGGVWLLIQDKPLWLEEQFV